MARIRSWSKFEIIVALQDWAIKYGEPPRVKHWQHASATHPSASTVKNKFDTWNRALVAAGFPARSVGRAGHIDYDPIEPTHHANIG
jgi:hypothetical protein